MTDAKLIAHARSSRTTSDAFERKMYTLAFASSTIRAEGTLRQRSPMCLYLFCT